MPDSCAGGSRGSSRRPIARTPPSSPAPTPATPATSAPGSPRRPARPPAGRGRPAGPSPATGEGRGGRGAETQVRRPRAARPPARYGRRASVLWPGVARGAKSLPALDSIGPRRPRPRITALWGGGGRSPRGGLRKRLLPPGLADGAHRRGRSAFDHLHVVDVKILARRIRLDVPVDVVRRATPTGIKRDTDLGPVDAHGLRLRLKHGGRRQQAQDAAAGHH